MAGKIYKIIIVDDDADDHFLIKDAFKQLNYPFEIVALYNGLELLDFLKTQQSSADIDLVIMDLNMPTMNGITALAKLKQNPHHKDIPVFMFSTTREDSAYAECQQLGAIDFYTKPNNGSELKNILSDMLERVTNAKNNLKFT